MKIKQVVLMVGAIVATASLSGCIVAGIGVAAAAGAGTAAYSKGEFVTSENVPLNSAWMAAQAAARDMKFETHKSTNTTQMAKLEALGAVDKMITLRLRKTGE